MCPVNYDGYLKRKNGYSMTANSAGHTYVFSPLSIIPQPVILSGEYVNVYVYEVDMFLEVLPVGEAYNQHTFLDDDNIS